MHLEDGGRCVSFIKQEGIKQVEVQKKERIFYLEFIRAFATLSIILTHYNALYIYMETPRLENTILSVFPFGIYIGNLGVSLFFIISGAALMYTYQDRLEVKKFFKKRFLSVYPMWWIAYTAAISYWFLTYKTFNPWSAEKWKILLTIIGFDHYFAHLTPTFAIVGEWFLGCIILLYLLFPIVRFGVVKYPRLSTATSIALYLGFIKFNPWPLWPSVNVFVRLPEFLFGMLFIRYIKGVNVKLLLLSLAVLIGTTIWNPSWDGNIKTTYIGIAFFLVLVYLSEFFKKNHTVKYICAKICKYSYAIFLSHHLVIYEIAKKFDLNTIGYWGSVMMLFVCIEFIVLVAFGLFHLHRILMLEMKNASSQSI